MKRKRSPVTIYSPWEFIDFSTFSTGSIAITPKVSSIGFPSLLVLFKRFSIVISSTSTSPKVSRTDRHFRSLLLPLSISFKRQEIIITSVKCPIVDENVRTFFDSHAILFGCFVFFYHPFIHSFIHSFVFFLDQLFNTESDVSV